MDATAPLIAKTEASPALLPPFITRPAANLWLWVLPIALLLALNLQGYELIADNLDPHQRAMAQTIGLVGAADLLLGLLLFLVTRTLVRRKKSEDGLTWWWSLPAVLVHVGYLWLAFAEVDSLLPRSVTAWIYPPERFLYNQFAFAMLPLFLGVLQIASAAPPTKTLKPLAISIAMAVGAPLTWYFIILVASEVSNLRIVGPVIVATIVVALGVVMFVGVVRALLLIMRLAQSWGLKAERVVVGLVALVLPLAGLALNRTIPFPADFQAWEVYALTIANAAILLLAAWKHRAWPRLSFFLLCVTLPFSLYFFIVLLPYTPLSILAVIAMGAGFLVLTPTFLFTLHLYLLHRSQRTWRQTGASARRMLAGGLACFLCLPAFFTIRGLADKAALNAALEYVSAPTITSGASTYPGSRVNLQRALANHRAYKNGVYYPFLSDFYRSLVFDNLVLPDTLLAHLEQTFFGTAGSNKNGDVFRSRNGSWFGRSMRDRTRPPRSAPMPHTAAIRLLELHARTVGENAVVTMALSLDNTELPAAEFRTTLPLPAGIFVNGFRLQVGDALVPGRLFEKKTARWVYTMIRDSEHRDPGLLAYQNDHELELSVFPIEHGKATKVEIDFLVPRAVAIGEAPTATLDPSAVLTWLGHSMAPQLAVGINGAYFTAGRGVAFPPVAREPYLHVIVDRSAENGFTGDLSNVLRRLEASFPNARRARVTLANYEVIDLAPAATSITTMLQAGAQNLDRTLPVRGGFALDLALAHALRAYRDSELDHTESDQPPPRPVFIIVSRKAETRLPDLPLTEAWSSVAGGLVVDEIDDNGPLLTLRNPETTSVPLLRLGASVRPLLPDQPVYFSSASAEKRLEYWSSAERRWLAVNGVERATEPATWTQAARLQQRQQAYAQDPGGSGFTLASLVKASRASGVLTAATSYIVVENPAQWKMLELSESQKLGQNAALEFQETPAPPALWIVAAFTLCLGLGRRIRRQKEKRCVEALA